MEGAESRMSLIKRVAGASQPRRLRRSLSAVQSGARGKAHQRGSLRAAEGRQRARRVALRDARHVLVRQAVFDDKDAQH